MLTQNMKKINVKFKGPSNRLQHLNQFYNTILYKQTRINRKSANDTALRACHLRTFEVHSRKIGREDFRHFGISIKVRMQSISQQLWIGILAHLFGEGGIDVHIGHAVGLACELLICFV